MAQHIAARSIQNHQARNQRIRDSPPRSPAKHHSPELHDHELKVAVQIAVDHHLRTYETHIAELLRAIASCCDSEGAGAASVAEVLRDCSSSCIPLTESSDFSPDALHFSSADLKSTFQPSICSSDPPKDAISGTNSDLRKEVPWSDQQEPPKTRRSVRSMNDLQWVAADTTDSKASRVIHNCDDSEMLKLRKEFTVLQGHDDVFDTGRAFTHLSTPGYISHCFGSHGVAFHEWIIGQLNAGVPDTCLAPLASSFIFHLASSVMIILNMCLIVSKTDYDIQHLGNTDERVYKILEVAFSLYYLVELFIMIAAYRCYFFFGPDWGWNWFDVFVVGGSMVNLLMDLLTLDGVQMSFLRMLRFLKISRVFRMFHALRMFKEIRLMVETLISCLAIFSLCAAMLFLFVSMFAIIFTEGMVVFLGGNQDVDATLRETMLTEFGSVGAVMLRLVMAMTGGEDWSSQYNVLKEMGKGYAVLYVFFILYALFAFSNVIVGVFCEKTINLSIPSLDELMEQRRLKSSEEHEQLSSILQGVFGDSMHTMNKESFNILLNDPLAAAYFENRGANPMSAKRFFLLLLEMNQTDTVDYSTFISACLRLDGVASSMDLYVLGVEMRALQLTQAKTAKRLHEHMSDLREKVRSLQDKASASEHSLPQPGSNHSHSSLPTPPELCHRIDSAVRHVLDKRVTEFQAMVEPKRSSIEAKDLQQVANISDGMVASKEIEDCSQMEATCTKVQSMLDGLLTDLDKACKRMTNFQEEACTLRKPLRPPVAIKDSHTRSPMETPREILNSPQPTDHVKAHMFSPPSLRGKSDVRDGPVAVPSESPSTYMRYQSTAHPSSGRQHHHYLEGSMFGKSNMRDDMVTLEPHQSSTTTAFSIGLFKSKILQRRETEI